jgi:hypothetical protein
MSPMGFVFNLLKHVTNILQKVFLIAGRKKRWGYWDKAMG